MGSTPTGISGSRAAAIIGLSDYKTPFQAWQDIMEQRQPGFNAARGFLHEKFEGNAATRYGLAFEGSIAGLMLHEKKHVIENREKLCIDKKLDYATCHIDGTINGMLYEAKTTNQRAYWSKWGEPGTDRIPSDYAVQVQHNLMCSGYDHCVVAVLVFPFLPDELEAQEVYATEGGNIVKGQEHTRISTTTLWAHTLSQMGFFHLYKIPAKYEIHDALREMYQDFYEKHIIGETPPEPNSYDDIKRIFPAPVGTIVCPPEIASMMREYRDIGKEIGSGGFLKKRQEQLKIKILEYIGQAEGVIDDESQEKVVFRDESGKKLGQFNGKVFRS